MNENATGDSQEGLTIWFIVRGNKILSKGCVHYRYNVCTKKVFQEADRRRYRTGAGIEYKEKTRVIMVQSSREEYR